MNVKEKSRWIPKNYVQIAKDEALGLEVWGNWEMRVAVGYSGKKMKPDINYKYGNVERMKKQIEEYVAGVKEAAEYKAKRKAEKLEANRNVKPEVGDILKASWGYDQTNIDYYEVVAVKGQMVEVQEIGQIREVEGYDCGRCAPVPGQYISGVKRYKAQSGYGGNGYYIKIDSCANASKMDPIGEAAGVKIYQPSYWSSYA